MIIGYTTGVFDLFHMGHLNLLRRARSLCDKLIVGVTTDELARKEKGDAPTICFWERAEIVRNIRFVDMVMIQKDMDKFYVWSKIKFNILFVGDDWFGTDKWKKYEKEFKPIGVKIIYLPYTKGISSSLIREIR